jgi:tetratricopeptide (TPR) repeat protein
VSELGEQEDVAAMVAHADGRWTRHVRWRLGEAWELPQIAGRVYDAYLCVTEYVMQAGEPYDELREFAQQLRVHARRAGARRGEAFATTVLGEAELLSGDLEAARDHLLEAARMSREVRATGSEASARARLAEASLLLGDRDAAAAQIEEALPLAYHSSLAPHILPLAHRIAINVPVDPAEAIERLGRAESILDPDSMCGFCGVGYYVAAAGACAGSRETRRGWEFLARAERGAELWRGGTPWSAAIAQARGELLLAERRVPEATVSLRRAVEGFAGAGQRLNERLAREALANVA